MLGELIMLLPSRVSGFFDVMLSVADTGWDFRSEGSSDAVAFEIDLLDSKFGRTAPVDLSECEVYRA